nr:leucine-rich repeat flightless-interacting protein 2-like isoform X1 [Mirounga angustirostris]
MLRFVLSWARHSSAPLRKLSLHPANSSLLIGACVFVCILMLVFFSSLKQTNGYDGDLHGSQSLNRRSGRNSSYSGEGRFSTLSSSREETLGLSCSDLGLPGAGLAPKPLSAQSGNRPSYLYGAARPAGSYRVSVFDESSLLSGARRGSACSFYAPSEHGGHLNSSSRASSRASSARASPVVEERPEKDFTEKGSRSLPGLSAAALASLGGTSRRGSGDTSISVDTEASIREIKELNELKDQIQDVEGKYMQGLKEMKVPVYGSVG